MHSNIAVVFPGQGSQSIGMVQDFYKTSKTVQNLFNKASEVLGYSLWEVIAHGPESELNKTEITQPAMLVSGYAVWLYLQENFPLTPNYFAGHSLGEYTALIAAKVFSFEDALRCVAKRARYMQEAVPLGQGSMAAIIGLDDEAIEKICIEVSETTAYVAPANYNAIGQVVIGGLKKGVHLAMQLAEQAGARLVKEIPVSAPSHTILMKEAAGRLEVDLEKTLFSTPTIPIIQNVDAKVHSSEASICQALIQQLDHPVQWVRTIQELVQYEIHTIIEVGPGKVLSGLCKRINRNLKIYSVCDLENFEKLQVSLQCQ